MQELIYDCCAVLCCAVQAAAFGHLMKDIITCSAVTGAQSTHMTRGRVLVYQMMAPSAASCTAS